MTNLAAIIVETFVMGTLRGDFFMELQTIFQNYMGDMGPTPAAHINPSALCVLADRGFVVAHYNHNGHFAGYKPSERALSCMYLQNPHGGRSMEPRDAFDARLVVERPEWADAPSGLGVAI
jgi:hypothetical protein